eukprot:scaffold38504_cov111-Phaeocystis_antarctica.AAC.2
MLDDFSAFILRPRYSTDQVEWATPIFAVNHVLEHIPGRKLWASARAEITIARVVLHLDLPRFLAGFVPTANRPPAAAKGKVQLRTHKGWVHAIAKDVNIGYAFYGRYQLVLQVHSNRKVHHSPSLLRAVECHDTSLRERPSSDRHGGIAICEAPEPRVQGCTHPRIKVQVQYGTARTLVKSVREGGNLEEPLRISAHRCDSIEHAEALDLVAGKGCPP